MTTQIVIVAEPEASECGSYDSVFTGPVSCGTTHAVPFSLWVSSLGGGGCVHTRGSFPSRLTYLLRLQAPDPCMRPEEPESGGEALEFAFRDTAKWWPRAGMSEGRLLSSLPRMPSFQPQLSVSLLSFHTAIFWYYFRRSSSVGFSAQNEQCSPCSSYLSISCLLKPPASLCYTCLLLPF